MMWLVLTRGSLVPTIQLPHFENRCLHEWRDGSTKNGMHQANADEGSNKWEGSKKLKSSKQKEEKEAEDGRGENEESVMRRGGVQREPP